MKPHGVSAASEHRPGDRFLFGPFEFRPVERLLLHQSVPVVLGSRAMDILLCLLDRHGDVVSPAELLASVWSEISVEPAALRVQISALRKALANADPGTRQQQGRPRLGPPGRHQSRAPPT